MSQISSRDVRITQAVASIPCEVEFPEGWDDVVRKTGQVVDGDHDRRRFPRWYCRLNAALQSRTTFPSMRRPSRWLRVLVRNISRCGLGFLHSEQLFPDETVLLVFPNGNQRIVQVMRCRRIGPKCFEIGGEFTELLEKPLEQDSASN